MDKRRQDVYGIFGNLLAGDFSSQTSQNQDQGTAPLTPGSSTPGPADPTSSGAPLSIARGPLNDQSYFTHGPTLTTSGVLTTTDPGSEALFQGYQGVGTMANDFLEAGFSPYESSIPSIPSFAEELPLFSLLSDLEPLSDQFLSGSG